MCKIGNQRWIIILMQFRLKRYGGALKKLYQTDYAVNQGSSVTLAPVWKMYSPDT